MQDKLLDQTSVSHLFPITKYLGLLATGMTGLSSIHILLPVTAAIPRPPRENIRCNLFALSVWFTKYSDSLGIVRI